MKVTVDLPSQKFSLGIAETGVVLGLLNALFLCFVIVQFSYLFGGESVINTSPEMTYAEYARRGFFELVIVAASVLPLLLLLHWLLPKENPNHVRIFRLLAGMLIGLLFVIMASALKRMWLYQRQYGLTELRLYTTAFIGWLAVVFIWFIATVLRGGRERFAFGALVSGFLAIVILHGLNPDAFIVRVNVARVESGHNLDTRYATSLSADAVPELIEALPHLSLQDGYSLANRILKGWSPATGSDWRRWSWGRSRAQKLVQRHKDALERFFPDETEETSRFR